MSDRYVVHADEPVDGDASDAAGSTAPADTQTPGAASAPESREAQAPGNAVTIVGDTVGTVGVSKHPEPSIPESPLSLADIERSRSRPWRWAIFLTLVLAAIIGPYWAGRLFAADSTKLVVHYLQIFSPQGLAFISWTVTLVALVGLALSVVESRNWLWRAVFVIGLAAEQFIAGLCLLKINFWYSTYVVYASSSGLANAANLGIAAAGVGAAVFAVLFVGLLVLVNKDSPLNVLTRSWVAFIVFFVLEVITLLIVLFGGLLTAV